MDLKQRGHQAALPPTDVDDPSGAREIVCGEDRRRFLPGVALMEHRRGGGMVVEIFEERLPVSGIEGWTASLNAVKHPSIRLP